MSSSDADIAAGLAPEFELLRLLGEGAMARVYLARETALQRLVAIKVLRAELATDDDARRRFEREARAAARLTHPGIVTIHRVGAMDDGTPYLVIGYVGDRTLADTLAAEGALTEEDARDILQQLASALAAAHAEGVVHRDVRPSNVLWSDTTGRVVLTDFGIAGILESGSEAVTRLTQVGQVLGSPRYMGPQQLMGEHLTDAADVYSLGIIGYELLTLEGPYRARTDAELASAHLRQPPRSLVALRPGTRPELADLLERCLAKKPQRRPRAAELARALDRLRSAGDARVPPISASPDTNAETMPVRTLTTVLFVDMVESTEKAAEMGDRQWTLLLRKYHALALTDLSDFGGVIVDTAGDGLLATFDSPARAIRCGQHLVEVAKNLGVEVRAGVHTGECERIGRRVSGIAVHLGARVMAAAAPSEILVSETVKALVAGSGIAFRDRGSHRLKGVPGEWRLLAVEG